tara:strand:+ start:441 stop:617 length:177 start_codon:yes stop_codon:yes gene_type:complete
MLLELHQLYRLTNLRTFWNFAILLNKYANLFTVCHHIHSIVDFSEIWLFYLRAKGELL